MSKTTFERVFDIIDADIAGLSDEAALEVMQRIGGALHDRIDAAIDSLPTKPPTPKQSFWQWFDGVARDAEATEVGKIMIAAGYRVEHTGGGCLAWVLDLTEADRQLVICDEEMGLGTNAIEQVWLVGVHGLTDAIDEVGTDVADLHAALAWCAAERTKLETPRPLEDA